MATRARDYVALAKPRLNLLVVASTLAGYAMADGEPLGLLRIVGLLLGTGLVAGGASAFNQVYERDTDALMRRTRHRPLPDQRLQPIEGVLFGAVIATAGSLMIAAASNLLAAGVALATLGIYVLIYTPLKRRTSFNTVIGAIPGALPPIVGWAAASGEITTKAWTLFGIMFLWQLPHFLAIAWMYRDDYARAGLPMLPVLEPDGRSTGRQAIAYCAALIPVSLAAAPLHMAGRAYFAGALVLGFVFLWLTFRFARTRSTRDARRAFFASLAYLPLLWILMIADKL
jgi:protoheme IX farnesyltransferase